MAELSPILVQVKLEADKLKADLDQASSKLKGFGDTAKSTGGPVSGLGTHIKGLVAGFVSLAVVTKATQYLKDAGKAAAEDAVSSGLLAQQLKNTTNATDEQVASVEKSIKAMSLQYGVADDKLRPAFASLVRSTKDVAEATKLTDLAQNVAAGTGRSLESVSLALGKAYNGNLGALQRLIPGIKNAKDPMAELAKQFDGAAAKAANLDPYQRLTVAMGEIKESVGTLVVPIVEKLADAMTKAEPVITKVVDALTKGGGDGGAGVAAIFNNISKSIEEFITGGGLEKFITGFVASREKILNALNDLLPKILNLIIAMLPSLLITGMKLFMTLVEAVVKVLPKLVNTFTEVVLPKLIDTLVELIPILIPAAIKLFLALVQGVAKALPKIIAAVTDLIPVIIKILIEAIPDLIDAGFQLLKGLIKGLWDNAPRLLGALAKDLGDLLIGGVKSVFGIKSPSKVFQEIGGYLGEGLALGITDKTPWAIAAANNQANSVVNVYEKMLDAVQDLQSKAVQLAVSVGAAWDSALSAVTFSMMNTGLTGSAALSAAQDALKNTMSVGGVDFTAKIAQSIAAASSAEGGYALYVNPTTGETMAVQGSMSAADLASIGLGAGSGFIQATTQSGGLTGNVTTSGTTVNVTNNITSTVSPAEIAQATVDAIRFNSGGTAIVGL